MDYGKTLDSLVIICERLTQLREDGKDTDAVREEILYLEKARFRAARYLDALLTLRYGEVQTVGNYSNAELAAQKVHDFVEDQYQKAGGGKTLQVVEERERKRLTGWCAVYCRADSCPDTPPGTGPDIPEGWDQYPHPGPGHLWMTVSTYAPGTGWQPFDPPSHLAQAKEVRKVEDATAQSNLSRPRYDLYKMQAREHEVYRSVRNAIQELNTREYQECRARLGYVLDLLKTPVDRITWDGTIKAD